MKDQVGGPQRGSRNRDNFTLLLLAVAFGCSFCLHARAHADISLQLQKSSEQEQDVSAESCSTSRLSDKSAEPRALPTEGEEALVPELFLQF